MKQVPPNYGMVEREIHRSDVPSAVHFGFLETLRLKTCVLLTTEAPTELIAWFRENKITVVQPEGLSGIKETAISEPVVTEVLKLLTVPASYPVLLVCAGGRYRTGTVVGCLRKLQRWTYASIVAEYRRFAGAKAREDNERFIELFDADLVPLAAQEGGERCPFLY